MAEILLVGMNHKSAPVEIRERLAMDPDHPSKVFQAFRASANVREGLFFSTCNRFEVIIVAKDTETAFREILKLFSSLGGFRPSELQPLVYRKIGPHAVRHMFMVAASLDSMVIGEPQILGQVKEFFRLAVQNRATGVILNRLMHRAFHTAKRIRTETGISESAVSVSYAAVELAKRIFQDLKGRNALLVGAGEMGELAAKHFIKNGIERLGVANRSLEKAVQLASSLRAKAFRLEELGELLAQNDIVLVSTGARDYVVTYEMVKAASKKRRDKPLFIIDISVPRNVEPRVNKLDNVYLYDIDDLKGIVELNLDHRRMEALKAERIVEEEVYKYMKWIETLEVVPTIVCLKKKAEEIVEVELRKSRALVQKLNEEDREALNILVKSIAEKILNDPIVFLKEKSGDDNLQTYIDVIQKLFNINQLKINGRMSRGE